MNIKGRIILFFAGLLAWGIAIWGANELSLTYNLWAALAQGTSADKMSILLAGSVLVVLVIGVVIFVQFFWHMDNGKRFDGNGDMFFTMLGAACFGFVFGAIVAPVKIQDGTAFWTTGYNFLLVLGFIPAVIVVKDLLIDAADVRCTKAVAR